MILLFLFPLLAAVLVYKGSQSVILVAAAISAKRKLSRAMDKCGLPECMVKYGIVELMGRYGVAYLTPPLGRPRPPPPAPPLIS